MKVRKRVREINGYLDVIKGVITTKGGDTGKGMVLR